MQVDQFESEVESLSVQTRKKKGDKEVSVLIFLPYLPVVDSQLRCWNYDKSMIMAKFISLVIVTGSIICKISL